VGSQVYTRRAFGTAIKTLIDYLGLYEDVMNVRIMLFLTGLPNYGSGEVIHSEKASKSEEGLYPSSNYYIEQGNSAAESRLCIDLSVVTSGKSIGLADIKYLSSLTSGNIRLYDPSILPLLVQDIQKQLGSTQAFHGALRIRTSPAIKLGQFYGHLYPDSTQTNLYHIQGCRPQQAFAFDLEFDDQLGLRLADRLPTIQLAFAYIHLEGLHPNQDPSNDKSRLQVHRRLRVYTIQCPIAVSPTQLYESADEKAILVLLSHKIMQASLEDGLKEGRFLLQDWLTVLLHQFNKNIYTKGSPLDLTFTKFTNLHNLTRFVFALFKSPLLQTTENIDTDRFAYLQWLYGESRASVLARLLYPLVFGWTDLEHSSGAELPLNNASLESSPSKIFVLDAYLSIYVYYSNRAKDLPYPPPANCELMANIEKVKNQRMNTPTVIITREGDDTAHYFHALLVEEQNAAGISFRQFLDYITSMVRKQRGDD